KRNILKEVGEHGEVARRLLNPGPFFPCPANQGPTKFPLGATRKATDGKTLCLDLTLSKCITAYPMLLEHLSFSRQLLGQERAMLREERHNFGVPVLEHRKDLAAQRDKLLCHQKEMAEGHASQLQRARSAAYGRLRGHGASRAEALGEMRERARQGACGAEQRLRLLDVSPSCAAYSRAISLLHKEMALNRDSAKREAAELASRNGQLEETAAASSRRARATLDERLE
ncbi:hypothetical protein T492DRAFT_1103769, partial [Pavlovales sp. CCMP2436]